MPRMKGPLGPSVSIIKSRVEVLHCHHTDRALVRLFFPLMFLQYFVCAQVGSRLYPFALGFRKGNDPVTVEGLAPDACREEFVGAGTDVFL